MSETAQSISDPPENRIGQGIILYCVCLILMVFIGFPGQAFSLTWGLLGTLVIVVLLPAVLFVRIKKIPVAQGLRLNRVSPAILLVSLFIGAGGWSLAIGVHELVVRVLGPALPVGLDVSTTKDYVIMLLLAAVMPGICEECLFRGALQGVFERKGKWFGILLAAGLFGLFHLDPWRILPAAFLGCIFGWLTVRTQSILPAITAHFANNATAITAGFVLEDEKTLYTLVLPVLVVVFGMAVFTLTRLTPSSDVKLENRNPLALVPAAVPTPVAWLGSLFIIAFAAVFGGGMFFIGSLITMVPMNDDALLPHIKQGDQLLLIKNGTFAFDIRGGDTVSFKQGDETISRVVTRVDGDIVFLKDGDLEIEIELDEVIGKMIQIMPN